MYVATGRNSDGAGSSATDHFGYDPEYDPDYISAGSEQFNPTGDQQFPNERSGDAGC